MGCYAVHAVKKGTGITGEKDLAILSAQLKKNVGLFSCNDWEVFSDQPAQLSPTITTRVVPANAEYGKFFRKDKPDHYINTPLFQGKDSSEEESQESQESNETTEDLQELEGNEDFVITSSCFVEATDGDGNLDEQTLEKCVQCFEEAD